MFTWIWFWMKVAAAVGAVAAVLFFVAVKFWLFKAPTIIEVSGDGVTHQPGGSITVVGGSRVRFEADDPTPADIPEKVHKCRFEIRYASGTQDKPKKGKWTQTLTIQDIKGAARVYAYNVCPWTSYASGKSEALDLTIV